MIGDQRAKHQKRVYFHAFAAFRTSSLIGDTRHGTSKLVVYQNAKKVIQGLGGTLLTVGQHGGTATEDTSGEGNISRLRDHLFVRRSHQGKNPPRESHSCERQLTCELPQAAVLQISYQYPGVDEYGVCQGKKTAPWMEKDSENELFHHIDEIDVYICQGLTTPRDVSAEAIPCNRKHQCI